MEVLLLILKIIGICLLVLLGIFLFLVLSILFVPVRYRIRGKGAIPKPLEAEVVFSWFFHIIHGRVRYGEEGVGFKVRLFGIPLRLGPKKPKKEKKKKQKRKKGSAKTKNVKETEIEDSFELDSLRKTELIKETEPIEKTESIKETKLIAKTEDFGNTETFGEHRNIFQRKADKIKRIFRNLKEKLLQLKEKLFQLKEQLGNIKIILSEETNRNAVAALFREFKYSMKHYAPRKASGELQFGTDDPANTGQILGIVSLFPFWYRYKVSVMPDFESEGLYAKGELSIKGHIRSIHLLISGIRLIKNKDIRKLINQIRK